MRVDRLFLGTSMKSMMRGGGLAALFLAVCLCGCSVRAPQVQYYVLAPRVGDSASKVLDVAVGFGGIEPSTIYTQQRIAFRPSDHRVSFYHYHMWAAAPDSMISDAVFDLLAGRGRFSRFEWTPASEPFDIVVTGRLREMVQDERTETWSAVLKIEWRIREGDRGALLRRLTTCQAVEASENTPESVAMAMSRAVEGSVEELSAALEKIVEEIGNRSIAEGRLLL